MSADTTQAFSRARNYAFYLLKFRNRSEQEIVRKLKEKKYSNEIIQTVIDYLTNARFLNDRQFARDWIKSRLNKPFGLKRISFELKNKGVDQEIILAAIHEAKESFPEEELVKSLAQKQIKKYGPIDRLKLKQRLFGFLSRRGFSVETIQKVIGKIC